MSVEGHTGQGRRGHAGVHEHAVAGLLQDDGDPAARGPRLPPRRRAQKDADASAIVNKQFAEHFFPGESAVGRHIGFGDGPRMKLDDRDRRRGRRLALRGAARGRAAAGVRPAAGARTAPRSTCARRGVGERRSRRSAARCAALDAGDPGLRDEDGGRAARRDAADRPADRDAVGRVRPAGHGAGVGGALRRDGVRRGAPAQGDWGCAWRSAPIPAR